MRSLACALCIVLLPAGCSTPTRIKELTNVTNQKLETISSLLQQFETRNASFKALRVREAKLIENDNRANDSELNNNIRVMQSKSKKTEVLIYEKLRDMQPTSDQVHFVGWDEAGNVSSDEVIGLAVIEAPDPALSDPEGDADRTKAFKKVREGLTKLQKDPGLNESLDLLLKILENVELPQS